MLSNDIDDISRVANTAHLLEDSTSLRVHSLCTHKKKRYAQNITAAYNNYQIIFMYEQLP